VRQERDEWADTYLSRRGAGPSARFLIEKWASIILDENLLDELESSKQSRLRTWNVLQRLRSVLSEAGNMTIPPPAQKTFDAEDEVLEHALTKTLRILNEATESLCSSVRRFRDATIKEECKSDYPHALQALWKALDRAEDLIQD
jgi:hypothetical protein